MEEQVRTWNDDEVDFVPRESQQDIQEGQLKEDASEVRKCDGCHVWKLLEEFPTKTKHFAIWFCNGCHGFRTKPKKAKNGEKFTRYNEYVIQCLNFKGELAVLRSEYQAELQRLKSEEEVIRNEYTNRKKAVLARKKEHEDTYRATLR